MLAEQGELLDDLTKALAVGAHKVEGVAPEVGHVVNAHQERPVRLDDGELAVAHQHPRHHAALGLDLTDGLPLGIADGEVVPKKTGHLVDHQEVMAEDRHDSMVAGIRLIALLESVSRWDEDTRAGAVRFVQHGTGRRCTRMERIGAISAARCVGVPQ